MFKENPVTASKFLRVNDKLIQYSGHKTTAVTLVHEFGHAMSNTQHSSAPHGDFTFILGNVKYHIAFNNGCNELWRLASMDYTPRFFN